MVNRGGVGPFVASARVGRDVNTGGAALGRLRRTSRSATSSAFAASPVASARAASSTSSSSGTGPGDGTSGLRRYASSSARSSRSGSGSSGRMPSRPERSCCRCVGSRSSPKSANSATRPPKRRSSTRARSSRASSGCRARCDVHSDRDRVTRNLAGLPRRLPVTGAGVRAAYATGTGLHVFFHDKRAPSSREARRGPIGPGRPTRCPGRTARWLEGTSRIPTGLVSLEMKPSCRGRRLALSCCWATGIERRVPAGAGDVRVGVRGSDWDASTPDEASKLARNGLGALSPTADQSGNSAQDLWVTHCLVRMHARFRPPLRLPLRLALRPAAAGRAASCARGSCRRPARDRA